MMSRISKIFAPVKGAFVKKAPSDKDRLLADLEAEIERESLSFQGTLLNRAGDICMKEGDREDAVRYYGRAIDALLEDEQPEAARGVAKKIIRIRPEAIRTLCTLTWLALAARHMATARQDLREYARAAKAGGQEELAGRHILAMAKLQKDVPFLEHSAESLDELGLEDDADLVREWVLAGGAPDLPKTEENLIARCLKGAGGSISERKADGVPA